MLKHAKTVLIVFVCGGLICFLSLFGLTLLIHFLVPTNLPNYSDQVSIEDPNLVSPDLNSFKNCVWDGKQSFQVQCGDFSFAFRRNGKYYVFSGNKPFFDSQADDSGLCAKIEKNGQFGGSCRDLKVVESVEPPNARFPNSHR